MEVKKRYSVFQLGQMNKIELFTLLPPFVKANEHFYNKYTHLTMASKERLITILLEEKLV